MHKKDMHLRPFILRAFRFEPFLRKLCNVVMLFRNYISLPLALDMYLQPKTRKEYLSIIKLSPIYTSKRPLTKKLIHTEASSSNLQVSYRIRFYICRSCDGLLDFSGLNDCSGLLWKLILVKWFMTIKRWRFKTYRGWRCIKCIQVNYSWGLHWIHFCIMRD